MLPAFNVGIITATRRLSIIFVIFFALQETAKSQNSHSPHSTDLEHPLPTGSKHFSTADFGITDSLDDQQQKIDQMLIFLRENPGSVVTIPANTRIRHSKALVLPNNTVLIGGGTSSIIESINPHNATIWLTTGCQIRNLKKTAPTAKSRGSTPLHHSIMIADDTLKSSRKAENVVIDHVTIEKSAGMGIQIHNSRNVIVSNSTINQTLADGIHITQASESITIKNSTISDVHDDGIAVVGYNRGTGDDGQPKYINITGNHIQGTPESGIKIAGSQIVSINRNTINRCGNGIYIMPEVEARFRTHKNSFLDIHANLISECSPSGQSGRHALAIKNTKHASITMNKFINNNSIFIITTDKTVNLSENTLDNTELQLIGHQKMN